VQRLDRRRPVVNGHRRLTVDAIAATMLTLVRPLPAVDHPVSDSLGCVLAASVVAATNVPPWPVATRDGYAVRAVDTMPARPSASVRLGVIGGVAVDNRTDPLAVSCAIRIVTGAPLPAGADAVVPAECCRAGPDASVEIVGAVDPGEFVASAGAEFEAGTPVLRADTVLGPPELAVLAALGHARVRVIPRTRVAVLATGTELSTPAGVVSTGKLHPSNVTLVQGMVAAFGAAVASVRVVSDDPGELSSALRDALAADLILTTGGTGRSSSDLVGRVLADQEADTLWKTPVRGSKPAAFRLLRQPTTGRLVPHLALPGRPIAAMVAFILFAYPLLRRLSGLPPSRPRYRWARLAAEIHGVPGRHRYVPVRLERRGKGWEAAPGGETALYGLAATAGSDGFAVLGRRTGGLGKGHRVRILLPPW
jgi:molybdopterin molybdotransferase